jgi:GNAT superfamily N-acetyltransferase
MSGSVSVQKEDPLGNVATQLLRELSSDIAQRYFDLDDEGSGSFNLNEALMPRSVFVVARLDDQPVGCGALRPIDHELAEVKRMYVSEGARRFGIGRSILEELERFAAEFDYRIIRLETGNRQPEAVALYEKYGFYRIPCFGKYIGNPVSMCFEKKVKLELAKS